MSVSRNVTVPAGSGRDSEPGFRDIDDIMPRRGAMRTLGVERAYPVASR
jgi:hypothetical protein